MCSALTEEQWSHLRENFAKRSAYRQRTGSQGDSFEEPETEDPAQTGEDLSRVDDTLLDLEPEETGTGAPLAGISPLTSLPAPLPAQNVPATSLTMGAVNQPTAPSSALFGAPHPMSQTVTQDILPPPGFIPHSTPGRQSVADRMAAMSFLQPQRAVSTTEIPQTPRTQLIRGQLEQQNFEMTNKLQEKNQQQIQDLSAQLQTGLQAFLQQSMEQMFNRLAPAQIQPPVAASSPPPHIVSITPVSAIPPAKSEEPMDAAPSQPAPLEVKKGLSKSKVKGSSAIAQQSIQAVVSKVVVPTSTPSTQPPPATATVSAPRLSSPLQALEQEEYGTDASASSFSSASKQEDPTEVGEQAPPPTFHSGNWSRKLGSFCPSLTQQQKRTISWAQHWDVIPFSCNRKS